MEDGVKSCLYHSPFGQASWEGLASHCLEQFKEKKKKTDRPPSHKVQFISNMCTAITIIA